MLQFYTLLANIARCISVNLPLAFLLLLYYNVHGLCQHRYI